MPGGQVFGPMFFLLMALAALTSSIIIAASKFKWIQLSALLFAEEIAVHFTALHNEQDIAQCLDVFCRILIHRDDVSKFANFQ